MQHKKAQPSCGNIFGVIVSYHPDIADLTKAVSSIHRAGLDVIIFDNTPTSNGTDTLRVEMTRNRRYKREIFIIGDGVNYGLATAYNKCTSLARQMNATGVVFFDQDSNVSAKSIYELLKAYEAIREQGIRIGVFGGQPIRKNGTPYRVKRLRKLEHWHPGLYEADFVISSFSFVHMDVLKETGPFREDLFIDLVDTEYSYRCRSLGYINLNCANITFIHKVGEADINLPTGRTSAISAPLRNYYQTRNIILVGRQYNRYGFIFLKLFKRFCAITLAGLIQHNLKKRLRHFASGIIDGLRGRGGAAT